MIREARKSATPLDEARRLIEQAVALEPGHHESRYELAQLELEQGLVSEAGARLEGLLDERPDCASFWTLLGFGTVSAMAFLRYLFPWWPLHPIGFVTATTYPAKIVPFSIFISWLAKLIILRAGGIQLYRKAMPFFLGLMLGYFGGVAISFVIDVIWFPGEGHSLGLYLPLHRQPSI